MTDRELLEYAAKAAGIAGPYDEGVQAIQFAAKATAYGEVRSYWDPLHDDAEAFRLAVKLDLLGDPRFWHERSVEYTVAAMSGDRQDPYAATRRAIVRAAAQIGAQS